MTHTFRALVPAVLALAVALTPARGPAAQEATAKPEQPRFRAGANLVRVDAYVSHDGVAVTDLTAADFEVFEDGAPQRVENFELIRARGPVAQALRAEPNTVAESRAMAADPAARLFVIFMDIWHVHLEGSWRAKNPVINMLDRVIGQDDMVGIMTPEMSARNLTLARRTTTIEGIFRDNWFWGERQRLITSDPREREIEACYPDIPGTSTAGIAQEMIERRRERKTLDAIEDLVIHLEGIREDRKFVIMLSEGWRHPRRNDGLARPIGEERRLPGVDPIGVGPDGRLTTARRDGLPSLGSCDRERQNLAAEDFEQEFQTLLQRANRANVSFYTIDPRGLPVFDEDMSSRRATDVIGDRVRLGSRQDSLRDLAGATDGFALLNTNDLDSALSRMMADIGSYYLLGYYSTNTKLDGRFRKLTVRVKRPGMQVRARPGYLAPTEVEAASARVDRLMNGAAPGHSDTPPELRRALDSIAPARGTMPLRVQTAAGPGHISITGELDSTTFKSAEWQQGGRARLLLEHERGAAAPIEKELTLDPGQRTFSLVESGQPSLAPGRYVIRVSLTPKGGSLPLQTTVDVVVPDSSALVGSNGVARRRGPATGLEYRATADARFQRTERIRFELPRLSPGVVTTARLVNRSGQTLPLTVTVSERVDETLKIPMIVADLVLAPLAQGEYVLEVAVEKDGKKQIATYGFRVVP